VATTTRALRPPKPAQTAEGAMLAAGSAEEQLALAGGEGGSSSPHVTVIDGEQQHIVIQGPQASAEPVILREIATPVRDQVIAIIEQRPEAATRVVRTWLKQD